MNIKNEIINIYTRYGFTLQKDYTSSGVLVFLMKAGYFKNVDIVPIDKLHDPKVAFSEFSELGYACSTRDYLTPDLVERHLFEGFFSIDSNQERLSHDYKKFTDAIIRPFGSHAKYDYLNAPYYIDEKIGTSTIVDEITSRLIIDKPILFLVEAAAGFGKTCSAYELVSKINKMDGKIPLFAELSRNRQARIFKHILLDEIDRTFPLLSSRLVQHEILNGRVITILDGFDELLRDGNIENDFDNREPMLETIGEYLKDSAKIILTTRRTVLFDGDDFHKWVEKNETEFSLVKIRISEPRVVDWLPQDRLSILRSIGIEINSIANPVLLSFLRCISDEKFSDICNEPEDLVSSYFKFMLDREKTRQELILDEDGQNAVLTGIASDMIAYQYKSEDRDYIVSIILEKNSKLIDKTISNYPANSRPTREEIANKLASHALLDRSARNPNKIGFVNDFVLGNYVARNITTSKDWLNDDWNFLEVAIQSFRPRSEKTRLALWEKVSYTLDFLNLTDKITAALALRRSIDFDILNGEVNSLTFDNVVIGNNKVQTIQFNDCTFKNCIFDVSKISDVNFLNCRIFDCDIINIEPKNDIHLLGCQGDPSSLNAFKSITPKLTEYQDDDSATDYFSDAEKAVLEKFWPVGRETITYKHRPIKGICIRSGNITPEEMYAAVSSLKRRKLLLEPRSSSFVEINFDQINKIKEILGR